MAGQKFGIRIDADRDGATVHVGDRTLRVESVWTPGDTLAVLRIDGDEMALKVDKMTQGFRIRHAGADLRVVIRTPRQTELADHMLEKVPPDTSRMLLCPMPGLIVRIDVAEGETVEEGQALAVVEAMKMENILRAQRRAVVSKVNAAPGDSLAVDDVILEFE